MESEAKKSGLYSPARDYKPLQVKLGAGQVIPGFEEAILGMAINEEKEVTIPPEKAYGKKGNHPMSGKTLVFKTESDQHQTVDFLGIFRPALFPKKLLQITRSTCAFAS